MSVGTKVNPQNEKGFFGVNQKTFYMKVKQYESLRFMSTPNCLHEFIIQSAFTSSSGCADIPLSKTILLSNTCSIVVSVLA